MVQKDQSQWAIAPHVLLTASACGQPVVEREGGGLFRRDNQATLTPGHVQHLADSMCTSTRSSCLSSFAPGRLDWLSLGGRCNNVSKLTEGPGRCVDCINVLGSCLIYLLCTVHPACFFCLIIILRVLWWKGIGVLESHKCHLTNNKWENKLRFTPGTVFFCTCPFVWIEELQRSECLPNQDTEKLIAEIRDQVTWKSFNQIHRWVRTGIRQIDGFFLAGWILDENLYD